MEMSSYSASEVEALTKIRGQLIATEQLMSSHFNKIITSSRRIARKVEEDVENLGEYEQYLEQKLLACVTLARSRAQSIVKTLPSAPSKITVGSNVSPEDLKIQCELVKDEEKESWLNCLEYSSSSSMSPPQLPFIVRPQSIGEQKQMVRFSTKKLEETKFPNSYTFFGTFPLELRGQILTVNLLIRKGQNGEYDLVTCFPLVQQQQQPEDSTYYGFTEVIINVLDTSGLVAIAKNFIIDVGNGNGCESGKTRRDPKSCQCDAKNGSTFLTAADVALFRKCTIVQKKRPFMMLHFNARITMRILPTSFSTSEESSFVPAQVPVEPEGDLRHDVADDLRIPSEMDDINQTHPVSFVPIDDFDEEIMTGLSPNAKKTYREWVCYENLNDWRQNVRINVELFHFAQHNSLMGLISHLVHNLSRIPHDECSLEENLEVVTAGVMYGNASLLQRSVDHLGTRLA